MNIREHALSLFFALIFFLARAGQSVAGLIAHNEEQVSHGAPAVSWWDEEHARHGEAALSVGEYALSADFWNRTLQNWQSEFLAVASMVVLSIYLRQRGSPESKQVGAPHHLTPV